MKAEGALYDEVEGIASIYTESGRTGTEEWRLWKEEHVKASAGEGGDCGVHAWNGGACAREWSRAEFCEEINFWKSV